jgi:hypothetical protein
MGAFSGRRDLLPNITATSPPVSAGRHSFGVFVDTIPEVDAEDHPVWAMPPAGS